jgi:hypothetical protein
MTSLVLTKGYVISWHVNITLDCCARSKRFFGHDRWNSDEWEAGDVCEGKPEAVFGVSPCFGVSVLTDRLFLIHISEVRFAGPTSSSHVYTDEFSADRRSFKSLKRSIF